MSLRVISAVPSGNTSIVVIIQGETMDEVQSKPARELAIKTAVDNGFSRPGTSGLASTYPVSADGREFEAGMFGKVAVGGYRCDFKVMSGH